MKNKLPKTLTWEGIVLGAVIGLMFGIIITTIIVGILSTLPNVNNGIESGDICMDYDTFNDRQMTLIYCDEYLGNCVDKARKWEEEHPEGVEIPVENMSWFGGRF